MSAIATATRNKHDVSSATMTKKHVARCRICGQQVPPEMGVCYGCDVEMGIGDWSSRPWRHANLIGNFWGLGKQTTLHYARR